MKLTFEGFIKSVGLMELNVIIRDNSDIKVSKALEIVRDRANKDANKYDDVDVKAKLVDMRTGNIYQIYSDEMMSKYDIKNWYNVELDNEAIQKFLNSKVEIDYKDLFENLKKNNGFLELIKPDSIEIIKTVATNLKATLKQNTLKVTIKHNNLQTTIRRNNLKVTIIKDNTND